MLLIVKKVNTTKMHTISMAIFLTVLVCLLDFSHLSAPKQCSLLKQTSTFYIFLTRTYHILLKGFLQVHLPLCLYIFFFQSEPTYSSDH